MRELIYKDEAVRAVLHNEGQAAVAAVQNIEPLADVEKLFNDLHALMWFGDGCKICAHVTVEQREPYTKLGCELGGRADCRPLWRGFGKEQDGGNG